jgi:anti-sigma regulatory factor (Ser/Thr protein kinase)/putative methionine-R-sulfoxide reductase with GAF domain
MREALSADTAAILLLDRTSSELVARAAKGLEEEVEQAVRIPVGRGFGGTIAATGRPLIIPDVEHSIVLNPILREKGVRSLLGVPLMIHGETLGVLHVGTLEHRDFTEEDAMLLQLVGDRVALAIHAGLYERERAVARTLQRSFLPDGLPMTVGLDLASNYSPASGGEVGGDWYDVFVLPDGSVGLAIGDVVGRGLVAASTMAKVRNALRAYALESGPSDVVSRLNSFMLHLNPDEMATLLYGVFDPVSSSFRFCNAGHMPPVLRAPGGSTRVLETNPLPPVGASMTEMFEEHNELLEPGATLVLFTDGLIERRGESLDVGLERLVDAVREDLRPKAMCDHIMGWLVGEAEPTDDVAVLVARVAEWSERTELSFRAEAGQLVVLRRALERWLGVLGVTRELTYDVIAASGEAAANAVEHAYGPTGGAMTVTAERTPEGIMVRVRDHGRWRPPRGMERGRGTPMMEALADEVRIAPSDQGTSVELYWHRT